jgi:3-isopropylmalate/(R)-2-methylmalate dehydratase small subunit
MLEICYNVILKSDRLSKKWTGKNMEKFNKLTGIAAPMPLVNIDTDMIIPKQFLKTIKRSGLGANLFDEMRFDQDGNEIADFVLNKKAYRNAEIIVAGENFGCGSSREHAPWALLDFGIKCVISTSYADIFYNNCFKNGILPIVLKPEEVELLMEDSKNGENARISIDLERQIVQSSEGVEFSFEVDEFKKHCLLNGLDDIGLTMEKASSIDEFEEKYQRQMPWV